MQIGVPVRDFDSVPPGKRGVKLEYVVKLLEAAAVGQEGSNTHALVAGFIKPSTAPWRCSLWDTVPQQLTGCPRAFISHSWCVGFVPFLYIETQAYAFIFCCSCYSTRDEPVEDVAKNLCANLGTGLYTMDDYVWLAAVAVGGLCSGYLLGGSLSP
jgi:hypothetical protein